MREIFKGGWLQLKDRPKLLKKAVCQAEQWYILCVHDDKLPFLEIYNEKRDASYHKPVSVIDLIHCRYVTKAVEDTRTFLIGLLDRTLEMVALSERERDEWIQMLTFKLRRMGFMQAENNEYSTLPISTIPDDIDALTLASEHHSFIESTATMAQSSSVAPDVATSTNVHSVSSRRRSPASIRSAIPVRLIAGGSLRGSPIMMANNMESELPHRDPSSPLPRIPRDQSGGHLPPAGLTPSAPLSPLGRPSSGLSISSDSFSPQIMPGRLISNSDAVSMRRGTTASEDLLDLLDGDSGGIRHGTASSDSECAGSPGVLCSQVTTSRSDVRFDEMLTYEIPDWSPSSLPRNGAAQLGGDPWVPSNHCDLEPLDQGDETLRESDNRDDPGLRLLGVRSEATSTVFLMEQYGTVFSTSPSNCNDKTPSSVSYVRNQSDGVADSEDVSSIDSADDDDAGSFDSGADVSDQNKDAEADDNSVAMSKVSYRRRKLSKRKKNSSSTEMGGCPGDLVPPPLPPRRQASIPSGNFADFLRYSSATTASSGRGNSGCAVGAGSEPSARSSGDTLVATNANRVSSPYDFPHSPRSSRRRSGSPRSSGTGTCGDRSSVEDSFSSGPASANYDALLVGRAKKSLDSSTPSKGIKSLLKSPTIYSRTSPRKASEGAILNRNNNNSCASTQDDFTIIDDRNNQRNNNYKCIFDFESLLNPPVKSTGRSSCDEEIDEALLHRKRSGVVIAEVSELRQKFERNTGLKSAPPYSNSSLNEQNVSETHNGYSSVRKLTYGAVNDNDAVINNYFCDNGNDPSNCDPILYVNTGDCNGSTDDNLNLLRERGYSEVRRLVRTNSDSQSSSNRSSRSPGGTTQQQTPAFQNLSPASLPPPIPAKPSSTTTHMFQSPRNDVFHHSDSPRPQPGCPGGQGCPAASGTLPPSSLNFNLGDSNSGSANNDLLTTMTSDSSAGLQHSRSKSLVESELAGGGSLTPISERTEPTYDPRLLDLVEELGLTNSQIRAQDPNLPTSPPPALPTSPPPAPPLPPRNNRVYGGSLCGSGASGGLRNGLGHVPEPYATKQMDGGDSGLANGTPSCSPAPAKSIIEMEVRQILEHQSLPNGLRVNVPRQHSRNVVCVEMRGVLWIAGWHHSSNGCLRTVFRLGDQVLAVNDRAVANAQQYDGVMKETATSDKVTFLIKRCPFACVLYLVRDFERQDLGFVRDGGSNTVIDVTLGSVVDRAGLSRKTKCVLYSGPGSRDTHWVITEVNNRPLSILAKNNEAAQRLNAVGKDIAVLLQPQDFIKQMKKLLKSRKNYKEFVLS